MAVQIFILTLLKRKHLIFSTAAHGNVLRTEWVWTQPPICMVPDVYVDWPYHTWLKKGNFWCAIGYKYIPNFTSGSPNGDAKEMGGVYFHNCNKLLYDKRVCFRWIYQIAVRVPSLSIDLSRPFRAEIHINEWFSIFRYFLVFWSYFHKSYCMQRRLLDRGRLIVSGV